MLNYTYHAPTKVVFGKDTHKEIGPLLKGRAKKVLFHYGGQSVKKSGLYDQVLSSLKMSGIETVELGGVVPNPRLSLVKEGIALCRREKVDLILAVGGGSVIDSAKAMGLGVVDQGDVWDFYQKKRVPEKTLPIAVILTIPATGSETSNSSVITNADTKQKMGLNHDVTRSSLSIINPELFFTLPKNQIANSVADMMAHIFERYFTNTLATDATDALCEAALRTILRFGPVVFKDPRDYDAWCQVGFCGSLAHVGILGCGRQEDWACHKMEHELSALYDVAHGAGLTAIIPSWMRYVYRDNVGIFFQFATQVMGLPVNGREMEPVVLEGIDRLEAFFKSLGLPVSLTELGIGEKDFETMAKKATTDAYGKPFQLGGLKKLGPEDVLAIYRLAK